MTQISEASLQGLNIKQLHDLKQQWQRAASACAEGSPAEHEASATVAQINLALTQRNKGAPRP